MTYLQPASSASTLPPATSPNIKQGTVASPAYIHYMGSVQGGYFIIPPAKHSFRGVYCFQPVRHSVIPSIRHSDSIFLRFCSVTLVALTRFCSNFHHTLTIRHCMFYRKKGAEGSVLQELCHFVILTARDHF